MKEHEAISLIMSKSNSHRSDQHSLNYRILLVLIKFLEAQGYVDLSREVFRNLNAQIK